MLVMLIRFIDMGNFILTLKSILPWTGMLEYIKWRKWGDHKHLFLSPLPDCECNESPSTSCSLEFPVMVSSSLEL